MIESLKDIESFHTIPWDLKALHYIFKQMLLAKFILKMSKTCPAGGTCLKICSKSSSRFFNRFSSNSTHSYSSQTHTHPTQTSSRTSQHFHFLFKLSSHQCVQKLYMFQLFGSVIALRWYKQLAGQTWNRLLNFCSNPCHQKHQSPLQPDMRREAFQWTACSSHKPDPS